MAFHIVTEKCFLVCEKVTSILLEECAPVVVSLPRKRRRVSKGKRKVKGKVPAPKPERWFNLKISYYPVTNPSKNNSSYNKDPTEEYELNITIEGVKPAHTLYAEIIKEVQEQHPNEGYLDKLIDKMLAGEAFKVDEPNGIDREAEEIC